MRNTKNVQSAISSNVFVGLRAETFHAIDMHANSFHSDEGLDVFQELKNLRLDIESLKETINNKKLKDLQDVNVDTVTEGEVLVYHNDKWTAGTI